MSRSAPGSYYRNGRCAVTEVRDVRPDKTTRKSVDKVVRCTKRVGHEGRHEYMGRPFGDTRCDATEERWIDRGWEAHTKHVRCTELRGHDGPHLWRFVPFAESEEMTDA